MMLRFQKTAFTSNYTGVHTMLAVRAKLIIVLQVGLRGRGTTNLQFTYFGPEMFFAILLLISLCRCNFVIYNVHNSWMMHCRLIVQ